MQTFMIQVIFANRFEDFYVKVVSAEQAIEIVRAKCSAQVRRWGRFVA